jgi:hypothetical protein
MRDAIPMRISLACSFIFVILLLCNASAVVLQGSKLSEGNAERAIDVPKELVRLITKDEDLEGEIKWRADGTIENLNAVAIDLNRDGVPELIVSGRSSLCSATGNCMHWVYQKKGNGYRLLLRVGSAVFVDSEKTITSGFHDITAVQHDSAFSSFWRSYKFDGTRYRLSACFDQRYPMDEDGNVADKPITKRVKCNP